tara:strand:+ start:702 stop:1103 length:402 start_codon:yes stop_codon:yes gene_type:complete
MSKEQYKAFIEKVQSDSEIQQKLAEADLDLLSIAKELGFEVAKEDLVEADRQACIDEYGQDEISDIEIDVKDLETVSGGFGIKPANLNFSLGKLPGIKLPGAASKSSTTYWGPCCSTSFDAGKTISNPNPTKF